MIREFEAPIKGFSEGFNVDQAPPGYSFYMNNVRIIDTLDRKLRIGQRPGLEKKYIQLIAGVAGPIVDIGSVTIIA